MSTSWNTRVTWKQVGPMLGYAAVAGILQVVSKLFIENTLLAYGLVALSWLFFYMGVKEGIKSFKKDSTETHE